MRTQGDVYHPDFLSYDVGVGAGLAQQHIDSDDVTGWNSGTLDEYDLSAQLLRAKPYSATVGATKSEGLIARQFLGSLQTERETQNAAVFLRSESLPMTFQYSHSDTSQDGFTALARDFFAREDDRFRYSVNHDFSERSRAHFDFDHTESFQQSVGATITTQADTYTASHDHAFGNDSRHRLDSFFNYVDQTGTFDFESMRWQERLRLQHTPSLLSRYDFRLTDLQRETLSSRELRGQVGLERRLYESLVTTLDGFGSETDLDEQGTLTQYGGVLGLTYRKKNPWGLLLSSYNASLTASDQAGGGAMGIVTDETHTATELVPIQLNRTNIDVSTIRVKNASGVFFQEGDDYTVTESNGRVFLNVTTLGLFIPNITEGQELFVDYNFIIEPQRREDTLRQSLTLRERFRNGASVYYAYRRQDQDVSSTLADITADQYSVNTLGADYSNRGLFLLAEYSNEESTQIPSTSTRFEGRYRWLVGPRTSASVGASSQWLSFGEPDAHDVTLYRGNAQVLSRLTDAYSISATLDYRNEDDTRFGLTEGIQLDAELQYQYRQLRATVGAELSSLNRRDDQINSVFLYMRLQRRF
ncbi:MAG: hypothetical protein JW993_00425 [Sedimentisphaerales bacterium]|nr:hypothetical protein [Sedimentisphaerales bacterium]